VANRFDPRADNDVQQFDSVTERPAEQAGTADDDDDLVVMGANDVNAKCPITMKDVSAGARSWVPGLHGAWGARSGTGREAKGQG
jgi:hypothetical protein